MLPNQHCRVINMTKSQYLSLQDASLLVNKSPQTIRRLIKGNRIRYRKYKTPQGFTYLVEKTNLARYFEEHEREEEDDELLSDAELVEEFDPAIPEVATLKPLPQEPRMVHAEPIPQYTQPHQPVPQQETYDIAQGNGPSFQHNGFSGASHAERDSLQPIITQLVQQHREDKKRLFELLETFQKRILILEDQLKQLEAPEQKKRRRFFFF